MDKVVYPDSTGKQIIGFNVSVEERERLRRERNESILDESTKPIENLFGATIPSERGDV